MMRHATPTDFDFINALVFEGARNGHFECKLLTPAGTNYWVSELKSVLTTSSRLDGRNAQALIWQNSKKPIGFIILSAGSDNKGNELWMVAVQSEYRGKGEGKKMVIEVLNQFKGKNLALIARCAPQSQAMFHILTTNGFEHTTTGVKGDRGLMYIE